QVSPPGLRLPESGEAQEETRGASREGATMPAWGWALIIIGAATILAFAAYRVWRTRTLRQRFGSEYDRTLEDAGSRRGAESDLKRRQRPRPTFDRARAA